MKTRFAKTHEKLVIKGNIAELSISDYAIEELGDVVYLELPEVGHTINQGDRVIVIESVKTASDVYAPVSGTVTEVNEEATEDPSIINQLDENTGWLIKIELSDQAQDQLADLMDEQTYKKFLD